MWDAFWKTIGNTLARCAVVLAFAVIAVVGSLVMIVVLNCSS